MNEIPQYTIRPARADEASAIKMLVQRAGLDRTGLDWRNFKLAEDDAKQMLGFCQIRRYWGVRELGSLYVHQHLRGQGIGAALIRACLAEETPPVHLECVEARQGYYERHGFRRIPLWQAPLGLRIKSLVGGTVVWLFMRRRIIVMRWDG